MDKRKNNGGKRENSGRLKKDDVISLIETMDAIAVPNDVWLKLFDKVKENDVQAIKTWLSYRYGMPKQTVDNNTNLTVTDFDITKIYDKEA
jgi:hypothetical protein